jgi:[pyruvate, water dikinase]-phosphate phosphotransferase / [pyruvate, water dikinase] kinase
VPAHGLPVALKKHRKKNVVALTIEPRRLSEIRQRRFATWQLTDDFEYADLRDVIHEVRDAEGIYEKRSWPVIETTNLSVEETSTLVLQKLNLQRKLFE